MRVLPQTKCTGTVASVWSGIEGFRYCKSGKCIKLGKERGHITERAARSGSSKRPRTADEDDEPPIEAAEVEWWPTEIDMISAVQCAA